MTGTGLAEPCYVDTVAECPDPPAYVVLWQLETDELMPAVYCIRHTADVRRAYHGTDSILSVASLHP